MMENQIIVPKSNVGVGEVIFLAGPVSAGGGWQNEAIKYISSLNSNIPIAVPDYSGVLTGSYQFLGSGEVFETQLEWEQHYLEIAEKNGAILMWFPGQEKEMPISNNTGFPRTYARDTRPEIGGWGWGSLRHNPNLHVAVGGEEGFDGLYVQKRNFMKYAPHIKFNGTLEDTCRCAVDFL
jgi:hypothetical protein